MFTTRVSNRSSNMFVWVQALDSKLSLDTAMSLYGLEHSELFWEKALDTKLLMAWNKHTIVLAFRGTASFANALADLQVCFPCTLFGHPVGRWMLVLHGNLI